MPVIETRKSGGAVSQDSRPGYYQDEFGNWLKDRRQHGDRRGTQNTFPHHDRRLMRRRKTDHEILERETRLQIEEALEELDAERPRHSAPSAE
jgi:hypothetical protein